MNSVSIIILVLLIVSILLVIILPSSYKHLKYKEEDFSDVTTKIMSNVEDVPTIKLIEKKEKKTIFQKILGNTNNKIPFNITVNNNDEYVINVSNYVDYNFNGKGLVIAAAGNRYRYLTGLYCNLYVIRKYHKSNIPIEIFYVGKQEEFSPSIKKLIIDLGNITIINLLDRLDTNCNEEDLRGYQTKPLSILASTFEEVVLLDADALSFIDPYHLFNAEGYDASGMILFKDYVDCMSFISKDFVETIGIGVDKYCKYTGNYEIDSSCIVVNKSLCWNAIYTICIINVKSDSYHKSKNVLGDKDTILIGSMFVGFEPYISRPPPNVFINEKNKVVVGHLQSTMFNNEEIFTHYNNQKIDLSSIDLSGYTYLEVKNPKANQEVNKGYPLTEKILGSFEYSKKAMKILEPYISEELKNKVIFVNGISKGLIS